MSLLTAYRRTGADPPFGDPGAAHGVGMEGYYWRIVDAAGGRVVVALCGTCRTGARRWSVVALAAHPGGRLWERIVEDHDTDPERFGVRAGDVLEGSAASLRVRPAPGVELAVALAPRVGRPGRAFGALGPAHATPWLPQYWHPVVLEASVTGTLAIGGERIVLDGARAYLEKNWGRGFAGEWWWGQAGAFDAGDVTVAFAGGPVGAGPLRAPVSAVVLRRGAERHAFATPLAHVRSRARDGHWWLRARRPGWDVEVEGDAAGTAPHVLPVPAVASGIVEMRSHQYLAGRVALRVRRRGRLVLDAESPLAGLEYGLPSLSRARRGAARP